MHRRARLRGGYPEALGRARSDRRRAWFDAHITTLLQRDVRDLANIEGLTQLPRLLGLLASRTAGLLNQAELARSSQIPQSTLKRYLALLEATYLVYLLPPWSGNLGKRLVKAPKLFLTDTGLATHLMGVQAEHLSENRALAGHLLENFVVSELGKQAVWSRARPRLFHLRTQAGTEVDVVFEDGRGRCVGVEVKAKATPGPRDLRGLKAMKDLLGERFVRGVVLHTGRESVPFDRDLTALPLSALWKWSAAGG